MSFVRSRLRSLPLWAGLLAFLLVSAQARAEEQAPKPGKLFLWTVEKDGKKAYLLGSVHLAKKELWPLDSAIDEAYEASQAVAAEADITNVDQAKMGQIMMAKGMLPEGKTIADYLSEETMKKLQSYCEKRKLPLAGLSRLKPFVIEVMLVMEELQAGGFDAEAGIDMRYLKRAHADKKTVSEMESMEFQMDMFLTKIPLEDQVKAFEKGADDLGKAQEGLDAVMLAWEAGDGDKLHELISKGMDDSEDTKAFYKMMFTDRNVGMADKVEEYMKGDKTYFVIAGAGHMIGDDGIPALLRSRGYKVAQATAKGRKQAEETEEKPAKKAEEQPLEKAGSPK